MADEIVCETVADFLHRMSRVLGWNTSSKILPGDSITLGGKTVVYRPPPPRGEALEAFDAWMSNPHRPPLFIMSQRDIAHAAFHAGRASVKP